MTRFLGGGRGFRTAGHQHRFGRCTAVTTNPQDRQERTKNHLSGEEMRHEGVQSRSAGCLSLAVVGCSSGYEELNPTSNQGVCLRAPPRVSSKVCFKDFLESFSQMWHCTVELLRCCIWPSLGSCAVVDSSTPSCWDMLRRYDCKGHESRLELSGYMAACIAL